jgi:hypothetical protein
MSRLLDDSDGERIPRYEHNNEQVLVVKFVMQWSEECSMIMCVLCRLAVRSNGYYITFVEKFPTSLAIC